MIFRSEIMKEIEISTEYIKLDQFLKLAEIAETGGHAKLLIQDGLIKVNNGICLARGKKLRDEDIVEDHNGNRYIIKKL